MNKANKLLDICENAVELRTSVNGEEPHSHPEIYSDNNEFTGLGPADNGEIHKHPIGDEGTIQSGGKDNHTHKRSGGQPPEAGTVTDLEKEQLGVEDDVESTEDSE